MTDQQQSTLAAAMIVRDEEAYLPRALDSLLGVVDEVVIVDTGSTDRTKEIAAGYEGRFPLFRLLDFEWCDDFAAARNFALDHVTASWALQLDADEELACPRYPLQEVMDDPARDAWQLDVLTCENVAAAQAGKATVTTTLRLFRNRPDIRFWSPIHEHVGVADPSRIGHAAIPIIHFGPAVDSPEQQQQRHDRNTRMLKTALDQDPEDGHLWAMYGHELFRTGDYQEAYGAYLRSAQYTPDILAIYAPPMLRNLAYCYYQLGHREQAMAFLLDLESKFPEYTDLHFMEAEFLIMNGLTAEAISKLRHCLDIGDPGPAFISIGGTGSWRAAEALERLGAL